MERLLDEVFEGYQYHTCEASDKGFHYYQHRSELGQGGGLNNLEIRDPPQTVQIQCSTTRYSDTYYYLGRLKDQYYRITQKLSVYEPYFFYLRDSYKKFSVFVIGKFYPYPDKQSTKYNAVVQGLGNTVDDVKTLFRVGFNVDLSFDLLWGDTLVDHGEQKGNTVILHQKRFLQFSKYIYMVSEIKDKKINTLIRDSEMIYKLNQTSRPIYATGSLFMFNNFYEARAEIPESSWRAFVEDFFTFEKFPFTNVPVPGFKQVLLQAIKTVKVKKFLSFYFVYTVNARGTH